MNDPDTFDRAAVGFARNMIRAELNVVDEFDPHIEIERRVSFLAEYAMKYRMNAFVLGISGGVDSTTAGRLCQLAAERCTYPGHRAKFIAVRLPYNTQLDSADAEKALEFIKADMVLDINIGGATDALVQQITSAFAEHTVDGADRQFVSPFVEGNIKARMRMNAQYAIAGMFNGLVVGTDHAAEAVMGFFTKYGDGAADILPLSGLNKSQVRAMCEVLGAPSDLVNKVPTADLESDRPGLPDEQAHGVLYSDIDAFLSNKDIDLVAANKIIDMYVKTNHKRQLPVSFDTKGMNK